MKSERRNQYKNIWYYNSKMESIQEFNNSLISPRLGYINEICIIFDLHNQYYDIKDLFAKYLKNLQIYVEEEKIYETNGFILMLINKLYKKSYSDGKSMYVHLNFPLKLHPNVNVHMNVIIDEEIKDLGKIKYTTNYSSKNKNDYLISDIIQTTTYNCNRVNITKDENIIEYKLNTVSYTKHFLIYLSDGIKVNDITLSFNGITHTYSYEEMNKLLPYTQYRVSKLPKNLLYIPFMNDFHSGIDLSRIDSFKMEFRLNKNNGGHIYVIGEIIDFFSEATSSKLFTSYNSVDEYIGELKTYNETPILRISI